MVADRWRGAICDAERKSAEAGGIWPVHSSVLLGQHGPQSGSGLPTQINAYTINLMAYDPAKRRKNRRKHEIDLADCEPVLDGPMLTREDTREKYGEQRLVSLGWLQGRVVVLVWTDREDGPRMISCREAERHEQEAYFREYPPG